MVTKPKQSRKRPHKKTSDKMGTSGRLQRPYPRTPLSKAVEVIERIKTLNAGKPWPPKEIANAVGIAQRSTNFQYLISAAREFGLIDGNSRAEQIGLSQLGRDLAFAPSAEVEEQKRREALFQVDIFKKVFDHYEGNRLPDMQYLGNTLQREFGLPPEIHDEFVDLFRENCVFAGFPIGQENLQESYSSSSNLSGSTADHSAHTVIVSTPKGQKSERKAFVIMPFVEKSDHRPPGFFTEVLRALISPAATDVGFVVETANRQGSDVIQSTIINELLDADLVIADLTDHNPNVLFELGLRMSEKQKPVALIKSTDTGRLFDVDNMMRVFEYRPNLWPSTLQSDVPALTSHIRATWDGKGSTRSYLDILRRGPAVGK